MTPRGLTLSQAAKHCGVTPACYRQWMRLGMVPGFWEGTRRIDRLALDHALDTMSGDQRPTPKPEKQLSPYEQWEAQYG